MKPDGALSSEMDEVEVSPSELFNELGFLVIESRVPDYSPKGRVEGPHCPFAVGGMAKHHCDSEDYRCKRAQVAQQQMQMLWKNRIPMCIEVLLYPECEHGQERASSIDLGHYGLRDKCILLEQWTIYVLPKRCSDHCIVRPRELFQAVKSYLFFSQLSAWLNQTHGMAPRNIAYRISPPGEFCTSSFNEPPEWHTFPVCSASKCTGIKITVGSLPRRQEILWVSCPEESHQTLVQKQSGLTSAKHSRTTHKCPRSSDNQTSQSIYVPPDPQLLAGAVGGYSPKMGVVKHSPTAMSPRDSSEHFQINAQNRSRVKGPDWYDTRQEHSMQSPSYQVRLTPCISNREDIFSHTTLTPEWDAVTIQKQKQTGAIPKKPQHNSPSLCLNLHALSAPDLEEFNMPMQVKPAPARNRYQSPKVLMTKKSPGQGYYQRERNLWSPTACNKDSTDSDQSSPEIDKYLKNFTTKLEPLSPQEIQNYLASLSTKRGGKKDQAVSQSIQTELKFSDGEDNESLANSKIANIAASRLQHLSPSPSSSDSSDGCPTPVSSCTNLSKDKFNISPTESVSPVMSPRGQKGQRAISPLTKQIELLHVSKHTEHTDPDSSINDKVHFSIGPTKEDNIQSQDSVQNGFSKVKAIQNGSTIAASQNSASETVQNGVVKQSVQNGANVTLIPSDQQPVVTKLDPTMSSPCVQDGENPKPVYLKDQSDVDDGFMAFQKANPLIKTLMKKELAQHLQNQEEENGNHPVPTEHEKLTFRKSLEHSAGMIFHAATGLPLQSSPAPIKKNTSNSFDYDNSLTNIRAIKNSLSCANLDEQDKNKENDDKNENQRFYSTSAPASTNCLLGNFEESLLNGRIEPTGVVEGFSSEIGASGAFCPKHVSLPVTAFFFNLSDDNAPSPYLGHINLDALGKKRYHVPKQGTVQVTLFNPNKTVVKMFVVMYDLSDMPSNCQTFLRQRTMYMPIKGSSSDAQGEPAYLRYLIHLRFASSKSGKIYLHTDIRLIFARDQFEYDARVANYELRSFTEGPTNPKFSPKR